MKKLLLLTSLFSFISFSILSQVDPLIEAQILKKKIYLKEHNLDYFGRNNGGGGHHQIMSEPEQDCNSAIPVCQNVYSQPVSYSGYGNTQEVPSSSCLGNQEKNSVWYIFTVTASGSLIFQIDPVSGSDDYDFALYNITGTNCSGVTNGSAPEVNCNFSATAGSTGLQTGETNTSQPASGTNQNAPVNVTVGQTYVLVVSNYSSSQSGYTLDFTGGTASIFDNVPPTPQSVFAPCGQTNLTLQMSEAVTCASVAANASDFTITGPGGPFTISSASGVNCGTASSQVNMSFSPALQLNQTYTLTINTGSDANTLIDNCGNAAANGSQVTFTVSNPPATISGPTSVCEGSSITLTASNGTGWSWSPGGQTTQTINVSPTSNTTYSVTVTNGTCGTSSDTHAVTVNDSPDAAFSINPNPACVGQSVTFTNTSTLTQTCIPFLGCTDNPTNMLWSYGDGPLNFDAAIGVTDPSSDTQTHTYTVAGTYTVSLQATELGGCSNTQTMVIVVNPGSGPISASSDVSSVCPGQPAVLTASGGASYTWAGPSGFNSTSNPVTVNPTTTSSYTVTSPGCSGSNTATVTITVSTGTVSTGPVSGSTTVCPNATAVTYSVTNNAGSTYNWTVPAGATIVSGQGTNAITVDFGAGGGNVTVTETTTCGTGNASLIVAVNTTTLNPIIAGPATVCPNATNITYSVTATVGNSYNWTVPAGASIVSGQGTNSITVNFGVSGGNIDVAETSSCGSGTGSLSVSVSSIPVTSAITGPSPVCPNATGITYSVTATSGSTYNWTIPAGASIVSGQGTNSITVNFGANGGTIDVTETSSCGVGAPVSINVTTSSTPVTSAISGPDPICVNAVAQTYNVINTGGSTYNWSVPAGATISSGQGTNSIVVDFGSAGGTISVTETSTCGSGSPVTFSVTTTSAPATPVVIGSAAICANATAQTYSVTNNVGNTYNWSVPSGATITSGQGTNSINVNFGAAAGNISVTESNSCGTSVAGVLAVSLNPATVTSAVSGSSPVCENQMAVTFSVTNTPGSTYNWTVPSGATIVSGQGTNGISVNFGSLGGVVEVTETGICGAGTPAQMNVVVTLIPVSPVIIGNTTVCSSSTSQSYSVTNNAGSTYAWTSTGGITITGGASTNSILADFATTGGSLQVIETNTCGSANSTINVGVTSPTITVSPSTSSVCLGYSSTLIASGATTYTWTPAASLNTTSGSTVIASPTVTTTYTVVGTDAGCVGATTTTVTLSPPLPINIISSSSGVCNGTNSALTASGATSYSWLPSSSLNVSTGATVIATPNVTTTYTVTGSTPTCTGTETITIAVTPVPTINLTPSNVTICEGDSTQIDATGATTYAWAPNTNFTSLNGTNSSVLVFPPSSTTYTVIGSMNGCNNSAMVNVTVLPKIVANAGANDTICFGETTVLIGTGGTSSSWSPATWLSTPNSSFTNASPLGTINYIYTGSYSGQCAQSDTVKVVVNPLPIVDAGNDTIIDVEDHAVISAFSNTPVVSWSNVSTLNCSACLSPVAAPTETTTYILTATNQYGCVNADTVTIEVSQDYALYVPNAFSPNEDDINEGWKPQGFGIKKIQIYVYDRWGQKLFDANDLDTAWNGIYKGDLVQQDVYVYKISAETYSGNKISKVGHVTIVR